MSVAQKFSSLRLQCVKLLAVYFISMVLVSCGGGSSSDPVSPTPPPPPPGQISKAFKTKASTSQFLARATFGPTEEEINDLTGTEVSNWLLDQFGREPVLYRPRITDMVLALPNNERLQASDFTNLFLNEVITSDSQLRHRMVLALSEIIVVSSDGMLNSYPQTMAGYVDILSKNAFGNYRDLLEDITYSPAMAFYLTYIRNRKGDPSTGRVPDENYAREILQLFSIGLVELEMDGTPKTDSQGQEIETYDNSDITGLAKVFTGLSLQGSNFWQFYRDCPQLNRCPRIYEPLEMFDDYHSDLEKTFLGITIPENTDGRESIDMALDEIFNHPNVAPFVSRQLIQRFVTSHPKPDYVRRVANAFESGRFTLPNGSTVGTGKRGDLRATLAAVLLDENALRAPSEQADDFGKIREPMVRFVNWARAFGDNNPDSSDEYWLKDMTRHIGQHPFRAKHVFNFFEPGHIAPGTQTGAAGMTVPELQIINTNSVFGYINFINAFIYNTSPTYSRNPDNGVNADYSKQIALADNAQALIDNLDLILTGNQLSSVTKDRIKEVLAEMPIREDSEDEDKLERVKLAISMVMTSPAYLVQR